VNNKILLGIIAILILIVAFLLLRSPPASTQPLCGNSVCDPGEKESCMQDCKGGKLNTTKPDGGKNPETSQFCPDGVCDAKERAGGTCPQDCNRSVKPPVSTSCGDGFCSYGAEDSTTCPADCPQDACGNGMCDMYETAAGCPQDCYPDNLPYSVLIVHEESWSGMVEIVNLANQYHAPLTIMFWPGIVDYILENQSRIDLVHQWQAQGHEIGIHSQGCNEGPNRDPQCSDYACLKQGDAAKYERLAYPQPIKSGMSCWDPNLLPETYIYEASGYRDDGRSAFAIKFDIGQNRFLYGINTKPGYLESLPCGGATQKIAQYITLKPSEFYGAVFHTADYAGCCISDSSGNCIAWDDMSDCPGGHYVPSDKEPLKNWLRFLYTKDPQGVRRKTLSALMEDYVLPNNLTIDQDAICNSQDPRVNTCGILLSIDHNPPSGKKCFSVSAPGERLFNFERCLTTGTYCAYEGNERCSQSATPMYCPAKCIVTNISDFEETEYCPESCGNGYCTKSESPANCPQDCANCGNGVCDTDEKQTCPQDCVAPVKP